MITYMRCGIESKNTYKLSLAIFNQESGKQISDTKVFCKKMFRSIIYSILWKILSMKNDAYSWN